MTPLEQKLLKMGEHIVDNCTLGDDNQTAIDAVRNHMKKFWDPRMQQDIASLLQAEPEQFSATLRAAVERL